MTAASDANQSSSRVTERKPPSWSYVAFIYSFVDNPTFAEMTLGFGRISLCDGGCGTILLKYNLNPDSPDDPLESRFRLEKVEGITVLGADTLIAEDKVTFLKGHCV
jgi:hypothetical protein